TVGIKPDNSRVTNGDFQSEQLILDTLSGNAVALRSQPPFNGQPFKFLMEEDSRHDFAGRKQGFTFVIDPIDGTHGYSQNVGDEAYPWAVSIGLEHNGKTIASAVYR